MRHSEFDLPRGTSFTRACLARSLAAADAPRYAADRWGVDSGAYLLTKAGVGAGAQDGELARAAELTVEFIDAVRHATAMDRLALRRVPPRVPHASIIAPALAYWRKEGRAMKVSRQSFDRTTLNSLTIGALVVLQNATLNDSSPEAEALITRDVIGALATGSDRSFFDPDNAGTPDVEPASICYVDTGTEYPAAQLASTGDLVTDVQAALTSFRGELSTAAWVLPPKLAAVIGLVYGGKGVGADLGARGGTLAGLPAYVTEGLIADTSGAGPLILVDGGAIVLVDEGAEVKKSDVALLEFDDDPQADALAPTGAANNVVSLWQTECTALLASRSVNWRVCRPESVVVITAADYSPAS